MKNRYPLRRPIAKALYLILAITLAAGLGFGAAPVQRTSASTSENLLVNGDFEDPVVPYPYKYLPSIPGWTLLRGPTIELQHNIWPAASGDQLLELDSDGSSAIYQDVPTTPGAAYELRFAYSFRPSQDANQNVLEVLWNGVRVSDLITADGSGQTTTSWNYYSFIVVASGPISRLEFGDRGPSDKVGTMIDDVSLVQISAGNESWTTAQALELTPGVPAAVDQLLFKSGQSAWFKFPVTPGSRVVVQLTNLPANYDLTLYKDIEAAFQATLSSSQDLLRLGAEFAPDAFSPDAFSPDAFSPDAFSPDAFSPDAFSPDAFSPDAFSPDAFSPDAFSPDAFSPDAFSPDAFSPDAFSPDAFSPDAFSPDAFSSAAFSSAQTRSLIGVSAFDGTASEGIQANTWDNDSQFYVRVRGRNGAFSLDAPFHLEVLLLPGSCGAVSPSLPATSLSAQAGGYRTIILSDLARMEGTEAEKAELQARLAAFAGRPEVAGVVVDVGADARVAAANAQADANPECPFAKNLVAESIQAIIAAYRALNPLEYVVLIGNDDAIPFFRHPDQALLASEKNFVPPVQDATPSQASLKLGYVLSQDRYGSQVELSMKNSSLPIPDLAVGRLVETSAEVIGMLDAYDNSAGGVVPTPASALVTGYDFLEDSAQAVRAELEAGTGSPVDALIAPRDLSPLDPQAWSADDLRPLLLKDRHDLIFLAGHFSANSALAADYRSRLLASEVASAPADLENAIIFSAGCHAGYNIVNDHAIPNVTLEPDWAQAFAQQRATLIAGTGYQYGDTDFIEYSERLYLEFARALRAGTGPVPIGKALVAAKQNYLAETPQWRGIHEKALLQATLFGLPMLSVDLPAGRGAPPSDPSIVPSTSAFTRNPGSTLGLSYADVDITPSLAQHSLTLTNPADGSTVEAVYLSGSQGVVANPSEPVLPLEIRNVSVPEQVLRGVGWRGGSYTDLPGLLPLTGAAATEMRGVHTPFPTSVFYPVRFWDVNYYEALASAGAGSTRLMVFPAQFLSESAAASTGTLRRFDSLSFRLYYSSNITSYDADSTPALAAAPAITRVTSSAASDKVNFEVRVTGDPSAGVQEVWVTYTAASGPLAGKWQSLDLVQNPADSTLWQGTLPLSGTPAEELRFLVQAANGVGLVALNANQGEYFVPGIDPAAPAPQGQPTSLSIESPPASGAYGTRAAFRAVLTSGGAPLAGKTLVFGLGTQRRQAVTDGSGQASVEIPLLGLPGSERLRVSFAGDRDFQPSAAESPFSITKQATHIQLDLAAGAVQPGAGPLAVATLEDAAGRPLGHKTIFFIVSGDGGTFVAPVIGDFAGRAALEDLPLSPGTYTVDAYFSGTIPLPQGPVTLDDERYLPSSASGTLALNSPPSCSAAAPSIASIWPANNKMVPVTITGITDPDGDSFSLSITSIFQDERVGKIGPHSPDGAGIGTDTASVRAERDGSGDGRFYHISFRATDSFGATCDGVVLVSVPHNQGKPPVDGGPLYDSTVPDP